MNKKRRIAFVIDTEGWTFYNLALKMQNELSNYYDIEIIPGDIFNGNMVKLLILCKQFDLIHFFWRGYLSLLNSPGMDSYINSLGIEKEEFYREYVYSKVITTTVCDHLYLDEEEFWRTKEIFKYINNYFVTSEKIFNIYDNLEGIKKPNRVINDFVDLSVYKPVNLERFKEKNEFVIGWVGNSKFIGPGNDVDLKGVNKIIKPAIEELMNEGYKIRMKFADGSIEKIPQDEMPNYYNSIDIYICASKTEGTPMPVLESMACGIPIISTDVGIVQEAFGKKQKEYILSNRDKYQLKEKIKELIGDNTLLSTLSNENIANVEKFSLENIALKYKEFFDFNIYNKGVINE